jgi:hypothetical protein
MLGSFVDQSIGCPRGTPPQAAQRGAIYLTDRQTAPAVELFPPVDLPMFGGGGTVPTGCVQMGHLQGGLRCLGVA